MENLKRAKNFDGVTFTLSNIEFDTLIYNFREFIKCGRECNFAESYLQTIEHIVDVLSTISYFEDYSEDAHCMLGYYELKVFMDTIIEMLPQGQDDSINFENCLADPNTKKWNSKKENSHV